MGLSEDWRESAPSWRLWQQVILRSVDSLNSKVEPEEKRHTDERKKLREQRQVDVEEALCCVHPSCVVMAVNKAGLTNLARQKLMLPHKSQCQFCRQSFHHHNHKRAYKQRPHAA